MLKCTCLCFAAVPHQVVVLLLLSLHVPDDLNILSYRDLQLAIFKGLMSVHINPTDLPSHNVILHYDNLTVPVLSP